MSTIARTGATGLDGMLPELVQWSSSYGHDLTFAKEDLLGSAAHVTMLGRAGLIPVDDAQKLRDELIALFRDAQQGKLALPPGEEDVHMAVESELGKRLGPIAGRLHTARSRNDQVCLDLTLHVRDQAARRLEEVADLARRLIAMARPLVDLPLPAFTHRQRAQPISAAFLVASWASALLRAGETLAFVLDRTRLCPLGSGACSGTSLPIDRHLVASMLAFDGPTRNALDTTGDRDFALDFAWAGARVLLALGKLSADLVDYASAEYALVRLDGAVSTGSSMMPQKKNPDIFELLRGKTATGVANVVHLLTLVKGLPSGYNRDQQEDRQSILSTGPTIAACVRAVDLCIDHVHFRADRGEAALAEGFTQATDLAEALVRKGVPFREAYKAVGELVRRATTKNIALSALSLDEVRDVHPHLDAECMGVLDPRRALSAKESYGGTGPKAVLRSLDELQLLAGKLHDRAQLVPRLDAMLDHLASVPVEMR
jgi:argininosuccinate lyase